MGGVGSPREAAGTERARMSSSPRAEPGVSHRPEVLMARDGQADLYLHAARSRVCVPMWCHSGGGGEGYDKKGRR